eukprot:SAG31_NODE_1195_length_9445_cov_21.712711_8_plen_108_part_00
MFSWYNSVRIKFPFEYPRHTHKKKLDTALHSIKKLAALRSSTEAWYFVIFDRKFVVVCYFLARLQGAFCIYKPSGNSLEFRTRTEMCASCDAVDRKCAYVQIAIFGS